MKIIDSHVHFDVKGSEMTDVKADYIAKYGEDKWNYTQKKNQYQVEKWKKAWNFPERLPPEQDYKATAQRWLEEMDAHDIEKMVFVTGGGNDTLAEIVAINPQRFVGYAHHDPCAPGAAEELERAVKNGLKGYKLFAPVMSLAVDDPALNPVWEVAEKYEIPILIHFGILGAAGGIAYHRNINPICLHDVARAYPYIPFIIPHFGCGYPKDLLFMAWACPNIFVDTSGSNQWVNWMDYPLTLKDLFAKFSRQIGSQRILFGTDSEWFPRAFVKQYFDDQIRCCVESGLTDGDIENIFYRNMAGLLK